MKITVKETKKGVLKFNEVEFESLTVADEEKAVEMAGAGQGHLFMCALLSIACTFDGKKYPAEELLNLDRLDFAELGKLLAPKTQSEPKKESEEESSTLPDTVDSPTPKSRK